MRKLSTEVSWLAQGRSGGEREIHNSKPSGLATGHDPDRGNNSGHPSVIRRQQMHKALGSVPVQSDASLGQR